MKKRIGDKAKTLAVAFQSLLKNKKNGSNNSNFLYY